MQFVKRSPYIARRKTKIINNDAGNGTTGPKVRQSTQELAVPYMAAGAHPQIDIRPGQAQVSKKGVAHRLVIMLLRQFAG